MARLMLSGPKSFFIFLKKDVAKVQGFANCSGVERHEPTPHTTHMKPLTCIINGQEFTRISYTNFRSHEPVEAWYPSYNLQWLRERCDIEIVMA